MPEPDSPLSNETMLVHDERHSEGSISPPIYQSSNFSFATYQSMVDRFRGDSTQPVYSRVDNPTVSVLVVKICRWNAAKPLQHSRAAWQPLSTPY